jgi:hypothetical protein
MDADQTADYMETHHNWREPDASDIKIKINTIIWGDARPTATLEEMEKAAHDAFDAIWPLMELLPVK